MPRTARFVAARSAVARSAVLGAGVVVAGAGLLAGVTSAGAATATSVSAPAFRADAAVGASSCAVNVRSISSTVGHGDDDTAVFARAMSTARARAPHCYPHGPSGVAQAVVSVPAGTYRLANLRFPSNVRLEVNAAATLQEPANRVRSGQPVTVPMFEWDTAAKRDATITNVSVVGVGSATTSAKAAALRRGGSALRPFAVARYFTMNLNAATTGSTNYSVGFDLGNVRYFRIENLFSLQNATNQRNASTFTWPTSARPVITMHATRHSPVHGPFIQPTDGVVRNHVNLDGPRGFGPNQVNAATRVSFANVFTLGGTALRVETDGSTDSRGIPDRGATVDRVTGSNIVGLNCNRAVALTPHGQRNGTVTVSGVWAYSCNQAVASQADTKIATAHRGSFAHATVSQVRVQGGRSAQLDATTTLWRVGTSFMPYYVDRAATWHPVIGVVARAGSFTKP